MDVAAPKAGALLSRANRQWHIMIRSLFRWQTLTGIALGLVAGSVMALWFGGKGDTPPNGPIISESDGHLRELVIQYEPAAKEIVATPYRHFLGALEADVTVQVICPSRAAYEELTNLAGRVRCALRPIVVNHAMTTWSRDRWVALGPASSGGGLTLWSPRGEASEELWPARAGDERIGGDIAAALTPSVVARRSPLYFDGGDFLADADNVFVGPRVLPRNIQRTMQTKDELLRTFSQVFKRRVILLDEAPDHHVAMYMVSIGDRRMMVGDPSLGRGLWPAGTNASTHSLDFPGGPDFSPQTQHLFDAVAAQCARASYQVIRVPTIPSGDSRSYLTYVNVLLDQQPGRRIVYLPFYRGAEPLNAAARKIWEDAGYEVRPVDCTTTWRQFGCLHCLVNVLRRGPSAAGSWEPSTPNWTRNIQHSTPNIEGRAKPAFLGRRNLNVSSVEGKWGYFGGR